MAFPTHDQLFERVQAVVSPRGLDVEKISVSAAGAKSAVVIAIDGDSRPDLDVIEEMSELISADFDAAEAAGELNFGAGYRLEVSTPGLGEPLVRPRHFRRQRGRIAAFSLSVDESTLENRDSSGDLADLVDRGGNCIARIGALDESEEKLIITAAKGKALKIAAVRLDDIDRAVVEVEFSAPPENQQQICSLDFDEALAKRQS